MTPRQTAKLSRRDFLKMTTTAIVILAAGAPLHVTALEPDPISTTPELDSSSHTLDFQLRDFPSTLLHSETLILDRDETRLRLLFEKAIARTQLQTVLKKFDLVLEDFDDKCDRAIRRAGERVVSSDTDYWIRSINCKKPITQTDTDALQAELSLSLGWITPVYKDPNVEGRRGLSSPIPDLILIKFKSDNEAESVEMVKRFLERFQGYEIPRTAGSLIRYRRYRLSKTSATSVFEIHGTLQNSWITPLIEWGYLSFRPMLSLLQIVPGDDAYPSQWNMWTIKAGDDPSSCVKAPTTPTSAWDITTGDRNTVVWLIDNGWPSSTAMSEVASILIGGADCRQDPIVLSGAPWSVPPGDHAIPVAGLLAAPIEMPTDHCNTSSASGIGIAGIAGNISIYALVVGDAPTPDEAQRAIDHAINSPTQATLKALGVRSARIINFSYGNPWTQPSGAPAPYPMSWGYQFKDVEQMIRNATNLGFVFCAASGNYLLPDPGTPVMYPAGYPSAYATQNIQASRKVRMGIIAVGATTSNDVRATPATDPWGSYFGNELSLVAPGILVPSSYPGNRPTRYNGTSFATPQVAGAAALLLTKYSFLTNREVQEILELTADKVPPLASGDPPSTRSPFVGFGRLNVLNALNKAPEYLADLFIKDCPNDPGASPSACAIPYWEESDIVVRPVDDVTSINFDPTDWSMTKVVRSGLSNFLYVRVHNNGPAAARNVVVHARLLPIPSVGLTYSDWVIVDSLHLMPQSLVTTFSAVPSGRSVIAKFEITAAQVDEIYTASAGGSHPCALTHVTADNERDLISPAIDLVTRFNNLAQRNLSVVTVQPAQMTRYYFLLKGGATGNRERFIIETLDQNSRPARFGQGAVSLLLKAVTPEEARTRFPRPLAFGVEHLDLVEVVGGNFDRQARRIQILQPHCEVAYESSGPPPGGAFHLLELVTVISTSGPEELTIRISRGGAGGVTVKYRVFRHG